MTSFNKVILVGNLTRDPELRYTTEGTPIGKMGIAVNRRYKTKEGENKEEVSFFNVTAFGKQAEVVSKYLTKGAPILIDGRLSCRDYETEGGEKKRFYDVIMERFDFLPRVSRGGDAISRTGTDA
mgnify:FL=1